jgi:hypothetical protein
MYIENVNYYFPDFKRSVKCAIIIITIVIENNRSLKLRQTRRDNTSSLRCLLLNQHRTRGPLMGLLEGILAEGEGRERTGRRWRCRSQGKHNHPSYHTSSLTSTHPLDNHDKGPCDLTGGHFPPPAHIMPKTQPRRLGLRVFSPNLPPPAEGKHIKWTGC